MTSTPTDFSLSFFSPPRPLCSSRKNPYPPHGRSSEIPRRWGVLKVKILEAKYEAKPEFPGGMGCKTTIYGGGGGYGYFLELHNF